MQIYRISKCKYIKDLSGYGAYIGGGRWNSIGQYMLYTSQSIALSLLEVLVHFQPHLSPEGFCLLTLDVSEDAVEILKPKDLPLNWNQHPGIKTTQTIGDAFLQKNTGIALKVPSSIIEQEYNFLLNPRHPQFSKFVKIISVEPIMIDKRLVE